MKLKEFAEQLAKEKRNLQRCVYDLTINDLGDSQREEDGVSKQYEKDLTIIEQYSKNNEGNNDK